MGKRIYVGNLSYETDEAALRTALSQDGCRVERVNIVLDRETGRPRGFAFVEMATDEDAAQAISQWHEKDLQGRRLRVNEAEDRRPGGGPGGRPGGGSGGRPASGPPRGRPASGGGGYGGGGGGGYSGGGGSAGGGGYGGGGAPRGGAADRGARRAGADGKRGNDKKASRRRHDEDRDYGGRRGSQRFEGDEDEW